MKMNFRAMDILNVPQGYYLAHAISADLSLGAGVAKQLDTVYDLKAKLMRWHSPDDMDGVAPQVGDCLTVDNVFNLVDKQHRKCSVDYDDLKICFESMHNTANALGVKKIAMPKIGCGCDDLDWSKVKELIINEFEDWDGEILVCVLSDDDIEDDMDEADIDDFLSIENEDFSLDEDDSDEDENPIPDYYFTSDDLTATDDKHSLIGVKFSAFDDITIIGFGFECYISIDNGELVKYKYLFSTNSSIVFQKED